MKALVKIERNASFPSNHKNISQNPFFHLAVSLYPMQTVKIVFFYNSNKFMQVLQMASRCLILGHFFMLSISMLLTYSNPGYVVLSVKFVFKTLVFSASLKLLMKPLPYIHL